MQIIIMMLIVICILLIFLVAISLNIIIEINIGLDIYKRSGLINISILGIVIISIPFAMVQDENGISLHLGGRYGKIIQSLLTKVLSPQMVKENNKKVNPFANLSIIAVDVRAEFGSTNALSVTMLVETVRIAAISVLSYLRRRKDVDIFVDIKPNYKVAAFKLLGRGIFKITFADIIYGLVRRKNK